LDCGAAKEHHIQVIIGKHAELLKEVKKLFIFSSIDYFLNF